MFRKILIANRGEIACRIMKTATQMGVRTVAVYSDTDAASKHVSMADESVYIGGSAPADSYLRGDAIIAAAVSTGAEAIHPGYGFLSENPDFVEAVAAAGLVFIGPSAHAIRAMGLKDAAKALMAKTGVPVVPGYHGASQDPGLLAQEAARTGYPVLIKAVAGGGGKGMRLVTAPKDFETALESARAESMAAFGNDAVLIEKYIVHPRHIEIQVFGDGTDAVHLFERDCSLQRRHQKVIEEAPAPGMSEDLRRIMGQVAVTAAKTIGYAGAGTVEFIVDGTGELRQDGFWFMEMNTRLQVEHPVTEAITGVDLVEWQLKVAAGQPIPLRQDQLTITGHAFEARLYAEDAAKGFLPSTGRVEHLQFPENLRVDSGVRAGDCVSPYYDPMVAKLISYGQNRQDALRHLENGLAATEVAGSVTNLGFLLALCRHPEFANGQVDTGLIARDLESLTKTPSPGPDVIALAVLAAAGLDQGVPSNAGFNLWAPLCQTMRLTWQEQEITAQVRTLGAGQFSVEISGNTLDVTAAGDTWIVDGKPARCRVLHHGHQITLFAGHGFTFDVIDPLARASEADVAQALIQAPMPGLVKAVFVRPGQSVAKGDRLLILEAMKMEHALLAARDGVIGDVLVVEGAQVAASDGLIRLEDEE